MNQQTDFFSSNYIIPNCFELCKKSMPLLESILFEIKNNLVNFLNASGGITASTIEKEQTLTHGFSWIATYIESLNQLLSWAENLKNNKKFNLPESLILQIGFAEYLA